MTRLFVSVAKLIQSEVEKLSVNLEAVAGDLVRYVCINTVHVHVHVYAQNSTNS